MESSRRALAFARSLALLAPWVTHCRTEPSHEPIPGVGQGSAGAQSVVPADATTSIETLADAVSPAPVEIAEVSDDPQWRGCPSSRPAEGSACARASTARLCTYDPWRHRLRGRTAEHGDDGCECVPDDGGEAWRCHRLSFEGPLPPPELPA